MFNYRSNKFFMPELQTQLIVIAYNMAPMSQAMYRYTFKFINSLLFAAQLKDPLFLRRD
jgi:hypothetical protein